MTASNQGIIVIEPGTPVYEQIKQAIEFDRKISIQGRGFGQMAVKQGELMWTPTLRSLSESTLKREAPQNT